MHGCHALPNVRWWREIEVLLLLVLALLAHTVQLAAFPLRGEETRRTQVGVEMLERGDWVVPILQGEPCHYRPPLQNLVLGGSVWLHGEKSIQAVRLPGALATLLTVLMIYAHGRLFLSRLGAFGAAAAFATFGEILELGRLAETESIFTLLLSGALLTWHWGYLRDWSDGRMWCAAYALAALAALAKGSQAPLYLGGGTCVFLLLTGQWRRIFSWGHLCGLLTFAVVFGLWAVPYTLRMGLENTFRTIAGETMNNISTPNTFWLWGAHFVSFPVRTVVCLLPWSLLLSAYLLPAFWRTLGSAWQPSVFLLVCVGVSFPTIWLPANGLSRYWLPLYPCVALLIGVVVQRLGDGPLVEPVRKLWVHFTGAWSIVLGCLGGVLLFGSWLAHSMHPLFNQPTLQMGLLASALAVVAWRLWQARQHVDQRVRGAVFALALALAMLNSVWFVRYQEQRSNDTPAQVARLRALVPVEVALVSFEQVHHQVIFFHPGPIKQLPWPKQVDDIPADVSYFCFSGPPERFTLPIHWEKVAVLSCDRFQSERPNNVVTVGRIIPRSQLTAVR